jgi:hypothetical protein
LLAEKVLPKLLLILELRSGWKAPAESSFVGFHRLRLWPHWNLFGFHLFPHGHIPLLSRNILLIGLIFRFWSLFLHHFRPRRPALILIILCVLEIRERIHHVLLVEKSHILRLDRASFWPLFALGPVQNDQRLRLSLF